MFTRPKTLLCLAGIACVIFSIACLRITNGEAYGFTKPVKGTVTDYKSELVYYGYDDYFYEYRPIVEFKVKGLTYRSEGFEKQAGQIYSTGQKVRIKYKPGDSSMIFIIRQSPLRIAAYVFLIYGVGLFGFGLKERLRKFWSRDVPGKKINYM